VRVDKEEKRGYMKPTLPLKISPPNQARHPKHHASSRTPSPMCTHLCQLLRGRRRRQLSPPLFERHAGHPRPHQQHHHLLELVDAGAHALKLSVRLVRWVGWVVLGCVGLCCVVLCCVVLCRFVLCRAVMCCLGLCCLGLCGLELCAIWCSIATAGAQQATAAATAEQQGLI